MGRMTLKKVIENITYLGKSYKWTYKDSADFSDLPKNQKGQFVHAICYCDDKLVIFCGEKNNWVNTGDQIKPSEVSVGKLKKTSLDVLNRVIKNELNAKVIKFWPLGFDYSETGMYYHLYYVCRIEPLGKWIPDPISVVKKIELINPIDYKKFIDSDKTLYRQIERSLEIVGKANPTTSFKTS